MDLQFPDYFSPEIRDFVQRLLKKRTTDRMPLREVHRHPWITKHCDTAPDIRDLGSR